MPIYEYVCQECEHPYERIVLNQTERITCPQCGSDRHTLQFSIVRTNTKSDGGSFPSGGGSCCSSGGCGCG